jgi:hypothetical protein
MAGALFDRVDSQLQQLDDMLDSLGSRAAEPDTDFAGGSGPVSHFTSLVASERLQPQLRCDSRLFEEREDARDSAQPLLWTSEEPEFMTLQGERAGTHLPQPQVEYDILRRNALDSPRLVFRFGTAFLCILTASLLGVALH